MPKYGILITILDGKPCSKWLNNFHGEKFLTESLVEAHKERDHFAQSFRNSTYMVMCVDNVD